VKFIMTVSDNTGPTTDQWASRDLALALQLTEIECAIHGGGATDQDAHAFIDGLGDDEDGVRAALQKLRIYSSLNRPVAAAIVLAPLHDGWTPSTRKLSVALAMAMNFDRKQAMAAATLAAERM